MLQPPSETRKVKGFRSLLGRSRTRAALLVLSSTAMGLAEAGVLVMVARAATSLANGSRRVDASLGPLHVHASLPHFLLAAAALACLRLVLAVPTSVLGARITADVQATLLHGLFDWFARASWSVKATDLEGHLQELMTNQVTQAVQGSAWATNLLTNLFAFLALVAAALVYQPAGGDDRRRRVGRPLHAAPPAEPGRHSQRARVVGRTARSGRRRERGDAFGRRDAGLRRRGGPAEADRCTDRPQQRAALQDATRAQIRAAYQGAVYLLLVGGLGVIYAVDKNGRVPGRRRPPARPRRNIRERGTERLPGGPAVASIRRACPSRGGP